MGKVTRQCPNCEAEVTGEAKDFCFPVKCWNCKETAIFCEVSTNDDEFEIDDDFLFNDYDIGKSPASDNVRREEAQINKAPSSRPNKNIQKGISACGKIVSAIIAICGWALIKSKGCARPQKPNTNVQRSLQYKPSIPIKIGRMQYLRNLREDDEHRRK